MTPSLADCFTYLRTHVLRYIAAIYTQYPISRVETGVAEHLTLEKFSPDIEEWTNSVGCCRASLRLSCSPWESKSKSTQHHYITPRLPHLPTERYAEHAWVLRNALVYLGKDRTHHPVLPLSSWRGFFLSWHKAIALQSLPVRYLWLLSKSKNPKNFRECSAIPVSTLSEAETACQKWGGSVFIKWGVILLLYTFILNTSGQGY